MFNGISVRVICEAMCLFAIYNDFFHGPLNSRLRDLKNSGIIQGGEGLILFFFCSSVSQNSQDVLRGSSMPQSSAVLVKFPFLNMQHHQLDGGGCFHSHPWNSGMGWSRGDVLCCGCGWVGLSRGTEEQIWMFGIQKSSGDPCVGSDGGCRSQQGGKAVIQPDPAGTEQEELDEQQGWAES